MGFLQAVVNEDTSGDAALLRTEVNRLREELAAYRADAALQKVSMTPLGPAQLSIIP